jgi:phage terminase large subunit-like protein
MIKEQLKVRSKLLEVQEAYPLALANLWTPYCHRWDGKGSKSERDIGCGQPMERLGGKVWVCHKCNIKETRTSQLDGFLDMGAEATAIFGGNRAGKTEMAAMFAVATAAGNNQWWVKQWLYNNNLPLELIQPKPSTVIASALSYGDALGYVRPKLNKFLPKGTVYKGWRAQGKAKVHLPGGGEIISMSADSGRKKYQGIAATLCWLDEEHPLDIFEECLLRIVDTKGRILLSMTPLLGMTWPNELFILNEQNNDSFKYHKISGLDNPWISSVKMRKAVSHLSEEGQASRLYGDFTNQTGLVYPEFDRRLHVVKPFEIPKPWKTYRAIDFGVVNPFCCLVFAHDESDNTLYVVDEYFQTEKTTIYNGNQINKKFKQYEPFEYTVCDPESKDGRLLLARHCNIPNKAAPKHLGVINTINLVKGKLAPDAEGKPHLMVFSHCKELLKEFRLYSWKKSTNGKDGVKKQFDHGLDALRYMVAFLYRLNRHL